MSLRIAAFAFAAVSVLSAAAGCAVQDPSEPPPPAAPSPAQTHPVYLQALGDLRQAHWLVRHRGTGAAASSHEQIALDELDAAIAVIRAAGFDDGLGANDQAPPDVLAEGVPRLRQAAAVMRKVNLEVSMEQDGLFAQGLRGRALQHSMNAALGIANAFHDAQVAQ
jgi:hypothetical protein